jgi:hypothetical protein
VYAAIPSGKRMEVHHQALAFKIRQQAQLGGWHNMSADALVREITAFHRRRRHDEVVDAIIHIHIDQLFPVSSLQFCNL